MSKRKSYDVSSGNGQFEHSLKNHEDGKVLEPFLLEEKEGAGEKVGLKRTVTLVNAIGIIVGSIIGSGIFLTPGNVYATAQDPYWTLAVWTGCGLFSLVGAICFAELGTAITKSGGDYAYILEAFGPFAAFLTLWVTVLVLRPTTVAIVALTFAEYVIKPFFISCNLPDEVVNSAYLFAAACICLLTAVNCLSVAAAMKIQDIFTAAKLIALAIIILTGFGYLIYWSVTGEDGAEKLAESVFGANAEYYETSSFPKKFSPVDLSLSFYNGLFAYAGWNYLNFITEELIDPYVNLPRAIYIGLPLVTVIYVLANIAYFIVLTPSEFFLPAIGSTFGARAYPAYLQWAIPVFVALSTFGGVNGTLFTTARMFFAGAEQGQMPEILACVHVRRSTPVPALIFSCVVSILVMMTGSVKDLIVYVSFVLWVSTGVSVAALLVLRRTKPNLTRPIRVSLVFPWLYIILTTILVIASMVAEFKSTLIGILITLTGVPVYAFFVWWPEKSKPWRDILTICVAAPTEFIQKLLNVVPAEKSS